MLWLGYSGGPDGLDIEGNPMKKTLFVGIGMVCALVLGCGGIKRHKLDAGRGQSRDASDSQPAEKKDAARDGVPDLARDLPRIIEVGADAPLDSPSDRSLDAPRVGDKPTASDAGSIR